MIRDGQACCDHATESGDDVKPPAMAATARRRVNNMAFSLDL
jgi:hypothetical protein